MVIRKATAAELVADLTGGSLRVHYYDAVTNDKKECAFGTLSALEASLSTFLEANPHMTHFLALLTDGAAAYSGKYFALGLVKLSLALGVPILNQYIPEAGNGKSEVDAHFGERGSSCKATVAEGGHDIVLANQLAAALRRDGGGKGTEVIEFGTMRCEEGELKPSALPGVRGWHHRQYKYETAPALMFVSFEGFAHSTFEVTPMRCIDAMCLMCSRSLAHSKYSPSFFHCRSVSCRASSLRRPACLLAMWSRCGQRSKQIRLGST